MEDKLKFIYHHANDMIRFAEAKNAILIAFNGALIVGMIKLSSNFIAPYNWWLLAPIIYIVFMNVVSIYIALTAIFAQINPKETNLELRRSDNLLFFGSVAHLTKDELWDKMISRYNLESKNEIYEKDLCQQTIIVSQITVRKFKKFNQAMQWTFAGILTPISLLFFQATSNPNK
jgi:hypothetical protein